MKGLKVLMALMLVTTVLAGAMSPAAATGGGDGTYCNQEDNDNGLISDTDVASGSQVDADVISASDDDGDRNSNAGQQCDVNT